MKVGGKCVYYRKWFEKGIYFINDLVGPDGDFYDFNHIKNDLKVSTNFLEFQGIIRTLTTLKSNLNLKDTNYNLQQPIRPQSIKILNMDKKGSQRIYRILSNNDKKPTAQVKWHNELDLPVNFKWEHIFSAHHKIT